MNNQELIDALKEPNHEKFEEAWSTFMLNINLASQLREVQQGVAQEVVRGGSAWSAGTWSTSRASQAVYNITKIPLVASIEEYKSVWLFCLSMLWGLDIANLQLGDRAAEAAFALAERVSGDSRMVGEEEQEEDEEEADEPEVKLAWEEQPQALPRELAHIVAKVQRREGPLQVKGFLEKIPIFAELPRSAPVNNHRRDGMSKYDRILKVQQQQLLHLGRIHSYLYMGIQEGADKEMLLQLMQQTFQLVLEYTQKTEDQRKEDSIPGSVPQEGQQLFHKEDIQMATLNRNIQGKGQSFQFRSNVITHSPISPPCTPSLRPGKGQYRFRAYNGGKGFRSSNFKGYGSQPRGPPTEIFTDSIPYLHPTGFSYGSSGTSHGGFGRGFGGHSKGGKSSPTGKHNTFHWEPIHPLFSQLERENAMVAEECKLGCVTIGDPWCALPSTTTPLKQKALSKGSESNSVSPVNPRGIQRNWGCEIGNRKRSKTSHPLVCFRKNREWEEKGQVDLRLQRNQQLSVPPNLQNGPLGGHFPCIKEKHVGGKIDLKNAYFHLGLEEGLKPYLCHKVADKIYQFQGACFGLNSLPQLWTLLMKTFQKMWREKGIICFIYLDDILVIGQNQGSVQRDLEYMIKTLTEAGMHINWDKSVLQPAQQVQHLGFLIDFKSGTLQVPKEKIKTVKRELGKFLTHNTMACRKVASILGATRAFLQAMPFLRAFTDQMSTFLKTHQGKGWDRTFPIPSQLQDQVKEVKTLLESWQGREFLGKVAVRTLHSDSSQNAWAGVDITTGGIVQEYWRDQKGLHINVKELTAATNTVRSLGKPGEVVHLCVDNSVTYYYLKKGGEGPPT